LAGGGIIAGVLCIVALILLMPGPRYTYFVTLEGNDENTGLSPSQPLQTIQKALELAEPGDRIQLADGEYRQSVTSVRPGKQGAPITIIGGQKTVVYGDNEHNRVIEINHDFITLQGFKIDGQHGKGTSRKDFRDKLIYAVSKEPKHGIRGLIITNMTIQNAGGECVRLRYFVEDSQVSYSTIRHCGIYDFRFKEGGKNGEGIYIGTAPEQRADGRSPTADVDRSRRNHVHHNLIETYGNECVDIKEGASDNLVEHNTCRHQKDSDSGGMDARGNNNTFRYNIIEDNLGAGVRLGGDEETDGTHNNVYENTIRNNKRGALRILRLPQGTVCGNKLISNGKQEGQTVATTPCG
jgi:hypothetical protein